MDFTTLLVFFQAFGAALGAFTAVWGEFAYLHAMRDGNLDLAEIAHLDTLALGLKVGMTTILVSSLGLLVLAYSSEATLQPALTPVYWILIALSLLIIGITWALSQKRVSFALGSALLFTAWWFLSYLTIGWFSPLSFGAAVALLTVATAVVYALFYFVRRAASNLAQNAPQSSITPIAPMSLTDDR